MDDINTNKNKQEQISTSPVNDDKIDTETNNDDKKDLTNKILFGKYRVIKKIGEGSQSTIYSGENIKTKEGIAIKTEKMKTKDCLLKQEIKVLISLKNHPGIVNIITCGRSGENLLLVEKLLGKSLDILFLDSAKKFTLSDICQIAIQCLERLEFITGMYIPFVKIDIRNTPALNKVFEQYSIDTVVHCAGFKSIEESNLKPLEYYNDNVSCIMSLLRAMQRTGVRSLVHLSSLMVYAQSSLDLNEEIAFNYSYPNPYIKSQQMIEEIIKELGE